MSLLQKMIGAGLRPRVRGRAKGKSLQDVIVDLERARDALTPRIMAAKDTAGNREALNHFVGIERWSLSRVRVVLGAPFQLGSYRGYRLPDDATLARLQQAFADVREESIALAHELSAADADLTRTVRHNDLGELTAVEWFVYIVDHSSREIIRIRT